MKLYEEIILLKTWHRGKWCIENVISYYEPLIKPTKFGSHYFWTNFPFPNHGKENVLRGHDISNLTGLAKFKGFDLDKLSGRGIDVRLALRDITEPELGRHILEYAMNPIELQQSIF